MIVTDIHGEILRNAVVILSIIMAGWGLWLFFRGENVTGGYLGAAAIAEGVYLVQAAYGLFLFLSGIGELARPEAHILYGVVMILPLPAIYIYTHADLSRRAMLLYSLAFVFLIGISFRSIVTGG